MTTHMSKPINIKERYKIVPQMESYDKINCVYKPFIMFFNCANFISNHVNTDEIGFRLNYFNGCKNDNKYFYNKPEVTIIIGGSLVFGFGATSDKNTISSILSEKTNNIFLNFGATAFNSKQEILLFLNFYNKFVNIKNVIIVSGANDLYLNLENTEDEWGNLFFKKKYNKIFNSYLNKKISFHKLINIFDKIFKKKEKNITSRKINFNKLYENYCQNFKLWSNLSIGFNFKLHFFLQPLATWTKKNVSSEETKIFHILDSSNDIAHLNLKEISKLENYQNFTDLLNKSANKNKVNFVDLNVELKKSKNINNSLFVDRIHMNDLGYEEISNIILNNI